MRTSIEHNKEVFTKKGELRKNPPKQYICQNCGDKQNGRDANKIKLPGITFINCRSCYGKIMENENYSIWLEEHDKEIEEMRKKSKIDKLTFTKAFGGEKV